MNASQNVDLTAVPGEKVNNAIRVDSGQASMYIYLSRSGGSIEAYLISQQ
jgi:hypothetical protein